MDDFHKQQGGSKVARGPHRVCYQRELTAAISQFLPPQFFARWRFHGNANWTPQRLAWAACLMSWSTDSTLTDRLESVGALLGELFPRWRVGLALGGFGRACIRETPRMLDEVRRQLRSSVAGWLEQYRVFGWVVMAVDGSRFEAPRTRANEAGLGCAGREKTTPQIYQTTLQHVGTSLPWDFRIGPGTASERRQLDEMLPDLPGKSLLIADAGFISYDLCRVLLMGRHDFLLRVGGNTHLLEKLGFACETRERTVYLWPLRFHAIPPVVLRLIVLRDANKEPVYLVTNIDSESLPEEIASQIYRLRWGLETHFRGLKQTLGRDRVLSRTPATALAEQGWLNIGAWLLQLMTTAALIAANEQPRQWSVAKASREVRRTMRGCPSRCIRQPLCQRLGCAKIDGYQRKGPKQTRRGVQKKREKPPGPPKIRQATKKEQQLAQQFMRPP
ncbi:probable transposase [Blastopirellula marina DSM 3645]|uniref:Probable transposase n=2 Tax=Blastopirellula marina TaxID=124 RepID=A4A0C3_9BACT|nr:probable transposase [Blastopirellula marina DSM 3645]EAQ77743.1 probable transposase [Blastopirellula marina DSM 3645]